MIMNYTDHIQGTMVHWNVVYRSYCVVVWLWAVQWRWEETDVKVEHNIFVYKIFCFIV